MCAARTLGNSLEGVFLTLVTYQVHHTEGTLPNLTKDFVFTDFLHSR